MKVSVIQLPVGPLAANCYLVVNTENNECVIVDPGGDAPRIIAAALAYQPKAVLLTHAHFDHIAAADEVCAHFDIPLYIHEADVEALAEPVLNVSAFFGDPVRTITEATPLHDGETVILAGIPFKVMNTPGHTPGCCCFFLPEDQGILTGDTLFASGYGRTDFPGGSFPVLRKSLFKLFHITPKLVIYPGHDETGYVGRDPEEI